MCLKPMKPIKGINYKNNNVNQQGVNDMKNNSVNPHGIKTPDSVEDFRDNLRKYYWTDGGQGNSLYVQLPDGGTTWVEINKISSFEDIYEMTNTGFGGNGGSPCICPKIDMVKDGTEFMVETGQMMSFNGYFEDEKNYDVVSDQYQQDNPKWYSLDNQIGRGFFVLTLGERSGYGRSEKPLNSSNPLFN